MRIQRRENLNRERRDRDLARRREFVAECYKQGSKRTVRDLASSTTLSIGIVHKIKKAVEQDEKEALRRLLDPANNRRGRRTVLTKDEESLMSQAFQRFGATGRAIGEASAKEIMGNIANDGRIPGFKNGLPCGDTIRAFRARNPELRFRRAEAKEGVKLRAENYHHVKTYKSVLEEIFQKHP